MISAAMAPLLAALLQAAAPAPPPVTVEGVTVEAPRPQARVAATYPAQGAAAPFGVLVLTVTFDQPMDPEGADTGIAGPDAPRCLPTWRLLPDARTYVLLCSTEPGRSYAVRFGSDPARAIRSAQHKPSQPYELRFTTEPDRTDPSLADALRTAGRKATEGPVMDWRPPRPATP